MRMSQLLAPETAIAGLDAPDRKTALSRLVCALGSARGIDVEVASRDLEIRERTGLSLLPLKTGHVAIPHAATDACKQLMLAVAISPRGVIWDETTGQCANLVFLVLGPPQSRGLHLRVLSRIARICSDPDAANSLLNASSNEELIARIAAAERPLGDIEPGHELPTFCVLGAGPGGIAMAAHLAMTGCRVNLFTRNPERLAPIQARGGVDVTGEIEGFAALNLITTNPADAIDDADILMVVVPATAHRNMAHIVAPHLRDGQVLVLNPGRTGGALEVAQVIQAQNPPVRLYLAEAQTLLYAARMTNPGQVHIYGIKNSVPLATLPAYQIADILPVIRAALPQFVPGDNVLMTSLDNIGAVFHPAITMLNAGRIEDTHGDFEYYVQGVTPSVALVLEAIDRERVAVASALGIRAHTAREWLYLAYNAAGKTLLEAMRANPGYGGIKAAGTLQHRYISEDVPTSLVPVASIGEMLGVATPTIRAMIHLASLMHGVDYWAAGRTVDRLGIKGMSVKDIRFLVVGAEPDRLSAAPMPPAGRSRVGLSAVGDVAATASVGGWNGHRIAL